MLLPFTLDGSERAGALDHHIYFRPPGGAPITDRRCLGTACRLTKNLTDDMRLPKSTDQH